MPVIPPSIASPATPSHGDGDPRLPRAFVRCCRPDGTGVIAIVQPSEKTKAGFLARARALRDQAVREGDQGYGAVVVRDGVIVGEGRNYVVLHSDPTAHAELLAVRDAARRLKSRDLSDCDVYSTATPCPMCQGALYWARIRRYHNETTPEAGVAPKLSC